METEEQLIAALRQGDTSARRRVYERYVGYAMATALRYTAVRENAEDVVQDAFVKVLTTIDGFSYRGDGSLKAWVMRIVAHTACDFVRSHERITLTDVPLDIADEEPTDEESSPAVIPPKELTLMIGQLPAGYRLVLNLYVFEHYSHREIAQRLGIREQSSASQLARARRLLRRMIGASLMNSEK